MRKFIGLALATLLLIGVGAIAHSKGFFASGDLMGHRGDRPIPTPIVAQAPAQAVKTETVTYGTIEEQKLVGYLAYPEKAEGPLPALIVIQEWWGLNDNIKKMTERLAGEGYKALAVDLYNGEVAQTPEEAKKLITKANQNTPQLEKNLKKAYKYLEKKHKAPKIGSIGWCFGGKWSLNTALLFPDRLDAAVIYYGGGMETSTEALKTLEMPILGIFGALDKNPSVEVVEEFKANLEKLGKTAEIYIYEGADHAFANPSGTRYNAKAAEDAWEKTTTFFAKYLKG